MSDQNKNVKDSVDSFIKSLVDLLKEHEDSIVEVAGTVENWLTDLADAMQSDPNEHAEQEDPCDCDNYENNAVPEKVWVANMYYPGAKTGLRGRGPYELKYSDEADGYVGPSFPVTGVDPGRLGDTWSETSYHTLERVVFMHEDKEVVQAWLAGIDAHRKMVVWALGEEND